MRSPPPMFAWKVHSFWETLHKYIRKDKTILYNSRKWRILKISIRTSTTIKINYPYSKENQVMLRGEKNQGVQQQISINQSLRAQLNLLTLIVLASARKRRTAMRGTLCFRVCRSLRFILGTYKINQSLKALPI